jgi:hypothetical protein
VELSSGGGERTRASDCGHQLQIGPIHTGIVS